MGSVVELAEHRSTQPILAETVLDQLTIPLGFERGSFALFQAGYRTVRAVYNADPNALLAVPGIGKMRLEQIKRYFARNGLVYPSPRPFIPAQSERRLKA